MFAAPLHADDADRQFTFAARLMQQGETKLAEEAFGEFIRKFAADRRASDVHYYMALLARQRGDLKTAQQHLDKVANPLNVSPEALSLIRGQVKLETGDFAGAVSQLEKLDAQKLPDAESRATWSYLLAIAYRGIGNLPAAAKHFNTAGDAASSIRGPALLELGKVQLETKEPNAALASLTEALKANLDPARSAEARLLAADIAYQQQRFALAADLYREVVQRHQTTPQFKPALIGMLRALYASAQDEEIVRQHAALAQHIAPEQQAEALYLVAAAQVRRKQFPEARNTLLEFYKRFGSDHALSGEVAYLYATCFYQTDLAGFEKWMASIEAQLPRMEHRHELMYLRAQVSVKQERYDEAIARLAPLIDETDNPYARRALLQRAALREKTGDSTAASADYALYAQRYGQDPQAAVASRRAIDLAFSSGEMDKVVSLATPWLKQETIDPVEKPAVRFKLAIAQIKLGKLDEALANLDAVLNEKPAPDAELATLAHFYRGILLASRAAAPTPQKPADTTVAAIDALNASLRGSLADAQRNQAMGLIANLHRLAGRDDEALRTYEQLRQRQAPGSFDPLVAVYVARGLLERDQLEPALAWAAAVIDNKEADPAAVAESLFIAAQARHQLKQFSDAIATYQRLIAYSRGYADQGRLGLAQSLAAAGQLEDALSAYDGLQNLEASDIAATALLESGLIHAELGQRFMSAGDASAAETRLSEARKRLNRVAILYDLPQTEDLVMRALLALGQMETQAGDDAKAREIYERILKRPERTPWHDIAQAEMLLLAGQRGEGVMALRKMIQRHGTTEAAAHARSRLTALGEQP